MAVPTAVPSPVIDAVDTFLADARLTSVLVACSAGPDSVALAHAVAAVAARRKLRWALVHVNHHLRGKESERDQDFAVKLGRELGAPVKVTQARVNRGSGNLEERARDLRYAAFGRLARKGRFQAVLTGHTAEDQAETVFMNLLRGSGLEGLGGMKPLRTDASGTQIGRPFLTLGRDSVRSFGAAHGRSRRDGSNADTRFLRNYVRMKLFDQLERRLPGFQLRLARLADTVRADLPLIEEMTAAAMKAVGKIYKDGWLIDARRLAGLELGLQRRVLRKAAGRDLLTFDGVERLRNWMASPPSSGRTWQLKNGWTAERLSKSAGSSTPSLFWFRQVPSAAQGSRTLGSKKGR